MCRVNGLVKNVIMWLHVHSGWPRVGLSGLQLGICEGRGLINKKDTANTFLREYILKSYFTDLEIKKSYGKFQDFMTFVCNSAISRSVLQNTMNKFKVLQETGYFYHLEEKGGAFTPRTHPVVARIVIQVARLQCPVLPVIHSYQNEALAPPHETDSVRWMQQS